MSVIGGSGGASSGSSINPKSLLRAMMRHWWRILGLSLILSLPLAYVIYLKVEPTYEAAGLLRVEPATPNLYGVKLGDTGSSRFLDDYLQTQLTLVSSGKVLQRAVNDPRVSGFPMITESRDPIADLSKALVVFNLKDTFLIRVSFQSKDANEAYEIVRAVIGSYMKEVEDFGEATTNALIRNLNDEAATLQKEIATATDDLLKLTKKGTIQIAVNDPAAGDTKSQNEGEFVGNSVSEADYAEVRKAYFTAMMELDAAEQMLKKRREQEDPTKRTADEDSEAMIAGAAIDKQIEAEFHKDPAVVAILQEIDDKEHELKRVSDIARQSNEPASRWMKKRLLELDKQYRQLWESKYEEIRQMVMANGTADSSSKLTLKDLEAKVADLQSHAKAYEKSLKALKIENGEARLDAVKAEIMKAKIDDLQKIKSQIDTQLKQRMFEANNDLVRVEIADPVRPPLVPAQNKRIKLMAIVPVAVMAAIFGVFLLLEIKAERISDPDALSLRVQSEVFALPPLPSAREVQKMRELESGSNQIDRFIQRLDHLRFAVFGSQASVDQGRCVLVTSAVGGEGKSTLAAQLAARCGSSGISTILIDADMRRSSLGTLLDLPEGLGLSDVLKGNVSVEEAAIPVQGGTFHVLLAGTPIDDVSRILHGQNVGILITRLREMYDLIIIDSPPVLPVPDALVLGQWTDGAILASRFDISRFPQVERARRQLDLAGIPIVGTVINGMRSVDSYYGDYSYSRRQSPQSDPSNSI